MTDESNVRRSRESSDAGGEGPTQPEHAPADQPVPTSEAADPTVPNSPTAVPAEPKPEPGAPGRRKPSSDKSGRAPLPWEGWGHIRGTRVRTSTAVLLVVFIALLTLYGYTSERYGVVDPAPAPRRAVPTTPYVPPTTEQAPTTSETSVSPTTGPDDSTEPSYPQDETPGGTDSERDGQGTQTGPTTTGPIPGLPGVTIPEFRLPGGDTTSVPQR